MKMENENFKGHNSLCLNFYCRCTFSTVVYIHVCITRVMKYIICSHRYNCIRNNKTKTDIIF